MCVKSSPCSTSRPNTRSMGKRTVKYTNSSSCDSRGTTNSSSASRKSRTKKKPKYLSLRLDISPETSSKMAAHHQPPNQLNLFPLHPENRAAAAAEDDMQVEAEQEYDHEHEHVSYYLINPDEEDPSTSLTAILDAKTESTTACADGGSPGEESRTYGYREHDSSSLMRSALRNREREDMSEEKWVSYSEVIVEEKKEEEVTSCSHFGNLHQRLSLKLDYQEVMDAWSDKGPLFVEGGECPQTVPDLDDGLLFGHYPDAASALWTVPDITMNKTEADDNGEGWKMARQREASVLRYKEKRQNRLFSKRVRYEVRKLNAEKRPRMKGRFVKRDS